jgi:hypothetical protein
MQSMVTKTGFKVRCLAFVVWLISAFSVQAQLGNSESDLVFTPVTPCRIVDTRNAGGTIAGGGAPRAFISWGANYAAQGGSATNCNIPQGGVVTAVALNLLVVSPASPGWIAAWPFGLSQPLVSNLNFVAGDVVANSALLKVDATTGKWNLYTTSTTHFVADVTGYYSKPVSSGSLECESPSGAVGVPPNSSALGSKQCSAGYTLTGGGCDDYSLDSSLTVIKTAPMLDNSGWFCRWENRSTIEVTAWVRPRCCRIPGR